MKHFQYFAHISQDQSRRQTVLDHLEGTAKLAAEFASAFDAEEQGYLAGIAHDIGKYSQEFQRRLQGENIRVDHSTAGAYECSLLGQPLASLAIAGHHGGLPDFGSETDYPGKTTYWGRMNRAAQGPSASFPAYDAYKHEVVLPIQNLPAHIMTWSEAEIAFFIRMIYSCLVDADFMDTEAFMRNRQRDVIHTTMKELLDKLNAYCAGWFPPKNLLNAKRCEILQKCEAAGKKEKPGLFTLTVPTGGGKTVASLSFALHHAYKHGMNRIIYVIPYTSIIEQNAEKFSQILGAENVLEHHCGILHDIHSESTPEEIRKAQAVENWDSPVIVTTAVQFFESLFASCPSKCRKLHNIANSVIIFDEAQMIPLSYLRPCVYAIAQLVKHFRVSAVLCTATQPALGGIFKEFLPNVTAREICPDIDFDRFKRVTFAQAGVLTNEELAKRLQEQEQVLCIVNTRQRAKEIYDLMAGEYTFHLSTLMVPAHRKTVINKIKEHLNDGYPCRVISTSLIEAGVDVDFPAVYREEAGLDSILQAAGRCNREGRHTAENSVVTVFSTEGRTPSIFRAAMGAANHVLRKYASPDDPQAISSYFRELLDLSGKTAQDQHGILPLLNQLAFHQTEAAFHLIEDSTHTVYVPLPESKALIDQLLEGEKSKHLLRHLGQYSLSIYDQHYHELCVAGDIQPIDEENGVLVNPALYTINTGLSLEADNGKAEFI